jgi:hypothetical protein
LKSWYEIISTVIGRAIVNSACAILY